MSTPEADGAGIEAAAFVGAVGAAPATPGTGSGTVPPGVLFGEVAIGTGITGDGGGTFSVTDGDNRAGTPGRPGGTGIGSGGGGAGGTGPPAR